jgi:hypothetical protein
MDNVQEVWSGFSLENLREMEASPVLVWSVGFTFIQSWYHMTAMLKQC